MMALVDSEPRRFMAFGVAGLSCRRTAHAIKHARGHPWWTKPRAHRAVRDGRGLPAFGNDDPRVDDIAAEITRGLRKLRGAGASTAAEPVVVLTITSNVIPATARPRTAASAAHRSRPARTHARARQKRRWLRSTPSLACRTTRTGAWTA